MFAPWWRMNVIPVWLNLSFSFVTLNHFINDTKRLLIGKSGNFVKDFLANSISRDCDIKLWSFWGRMKVKINNSKRFMIEGAVERRIFAAFCDKLWNGFGIVGDCGRLWGLWEKRRNLNLNQKFGILFQQEIQKLHQKFSQINFGKIFCIQFYTPNPIPLLSNFLNDKNFF